MKTLLLSATALLLLAGSAAASADGDSLGVGMKAPALDHVNWLKGDKIAAWEPGQIYVLDFWATWCGPCKASIPHVNEMAKTHKQDGVNVIGVAIWPNSRMVPTDKFVADKGDEMDYNIAEDVEGQTAKTFMQAARCNGIPTMMVIDRKGEIAWIGHPMAIGDTLEKIMAGTDDRAAAIKADAERRATADEELKLSSALDGYDTLDAAAAAEVLQICEKRLAEHPGDPQTSYYKYMMLAKVGPREKAAAFGKELIEGPLKDIPQGLNLVAWGIVDPEHKVPVEQRDLVLALAAASRADELTSHADPSILDTLARVYFWKGDLAKAVELQKKAVDSADAEQKAQLQSTLDDYSKAAAAGGR